MRRATLPALCLALASPAATGAELPFELSPSLRAYQVYSDNIREAPEAEPSHFTLVSPGLAARNLSPVWPLRLLYSPDVYLFEQGPRAGSHPLTYRNFLLSEGRVETPSGFSLRLSYRYSQPLDPSRAEDVGFVQQRQSFLSGSLGYELTERIGGRLGGEARWVSFDDPARAAFGHRELGATGRLLFRALVKTSLLLEARGAAVHYDQPELGRDSSLVAALTGLDGQISPMLHASLKGGFGRRGASSGLLPSQTSPVGELELKGDPSAFTQLSISGYRRFEESYWRSNFAYLTTGATATFGLKATEKLSLVLVGALIWADYLSPEESDLGGQALRSDQRKQLDCALRYHLSTGIHLELNFSRRVRSSNYAEAAFQENRGMLSLAWFIGQEGPP